MSDLDEKLKEISIDSGYGTYGRLDDDAIGEIKQAFIDAGYEPVFVLNREQSYRATGDRIYRTATLRTEDEWKARNVGKLMTGQEWYDRFVGELPDPYRTPRELSPHNNETPEQKYASRGEKYMHAYALEAAKKAAGIE